MPILSRKDLERISRRVLFRYLTLSDRKMDRIDPVDFAEKICGLHFAFADMSVTGSILGLTSYSDVDLTISVPRGNGSVRASDSRYALPGGIQSKRAAVHLPPCG